MNQQTPRLFPNGHAAEAKRLAAQFRTDLSLFFSMKNELERLDKKGLVTYFGSARVERITTSKRVLTSLGLATIIPKDNSYAKAEELAYYLASRRYGSVSGWGHGVMEAALNGTCKAPNPLAIGVQTEKLSEREGFSDESSIQIQGYVVNSMEARQLAMLANSRAVVLFPGGFGTLDELIQALTLMQLKQLKPMPIILMGGRKRWQGFFDWLEAGPVKAGMINEFGQKLLKENIYFPKSPAEVLAILESNRAAPAPIDMWKMTYLFEDDLIKAFDALDRLKKGSFVAFFGSAQLDPNNAYYISAYQMAQLVGKNGWDIYSDGWSGIMEAVHNGATDAGVVSVGFVENDGQVQKSDLERSYVPMSLFSSRNHVAREAAAFLGFPGGFGTMNNLLKNAVAMQINEMERRPILLMHPEFWTAGEKEGLTGWMERELLDKGYIDQSHFNIISLVPNHGKGQERAIEIIERSLKDAA